jgi:hypothetical protein
MTGRKLWAEYQHYTRDLTQHERKLGFAGAAICWFFKRDDLTFPLLIYIALIFFIAYFIADILHYVSAALVLRFFIQYHEKKLFRETGKIEGDIIKPRWVDYPAFIFFIIKGVFLVFAFAFIGFYILTKLVC